MIKSYFIILFYVIGLFGFRYLIYFSDLGEKFLFRLRKNETNNLEYDYIVVGAGTAGSVIALRLSEDRNNSVLLLEAGSYGRPELLDIPIVAPILHRSVYDWQYKTTPQENACWAFKDNASSWPTGKIFGGSARLNHMLYTRGHPQDFKDWYKDIPNFNYETEILEYFKKSENQIGYLSNDTKYHHRGGPVVANDLLYVTNIHDVVMDAAKELHLPLRDINGEFSSGFSQPQVNMVNGNRFSTGHHLLENLKSNLIIKILAFAEEILFKENFEAYGVRYSIQGERYVAKARKGVIISAGTVSTAKLLMLSGIGPKNHLDTIGIKTKVDLPVGQNLQDHISTGFDMVTFENPSDLHMATVLTHAARYGFLKQGFFTSVGVDVVSFLNSNCLDAGKNYDQCEEIHGRPDFEIIFMLAGVSTDHGFRFKDTVGLKDSIWDEYFSNFVDKRAANFIPIVLRPKSRGYVRLQDKNPATNPIINPRYLTAKEDEDILIKGLKFVRTLTETKPMKEWGVQFNNATFPRCAHFGFDSDEYWRCYVKHISFTLYHPVGTCKMGPDSDTSTVVTRDFRVKGTNKLFVADGSVIPELISANTNAAIAMIAEKAADEIKYFDYLLNNVCYISEFFIPKTVC